MRSSARCPSGSAQAPPRAAMMAINMRSPKSSARSGGIMRAACSRTSPGPTQPTAARSATTTTSVATGAGRLRTVGSGGHSGRATAAMAATMSRSRIASVSSPLSVME